MSEPERILSLFSFDWDQAAQRRLAPRFRFEQAGFDLFQFPSSAQLLWFDMLGWVDKLARRYSERVKAGDLHAVVSHDEQFGALAAALLGEKLGLPHSPAQAVATIQHKLLLRQVIQRAAPHANVEFSALDCEYGQMPPQGLRYPLFIKPMKAAFSVLARRIDSYEQLVEHTRFGIFEQWIIRRLTKPFNDVARTLVSMPMDADHMIVEEPIAADQFNLDGYVCDGQVHSLGVVDAIMVPGTQAFLRFAYPSKLAPDIQQHAQRVAAAVLKEAGYTHGFFNMEFFYQASTGRLSVIEINPRAASQLADLYRWVDGNDVAAMALDLFCGRTPSTTPKQTPVAGAAASFVFRSFGEPPPPAASEEAKAWLKQAYPDARLMEFRKSHNNLKRDLKWLGSLRYAVLDMHAPTEQELHRSYSEICERLGWPCVL
jgi:hypothetical protein